MVCDRCKMAVKAEFQKLGLNPIKVELGEVEIVENKIDPTAYAQLEMELAKLGFSILSDAKDQLVAKVKSLIVDLVHYTNEPLKVNLSNYLSEQMDLNYVHLSSVFSEKTGLTIEKYFIEQKIEKVKELLAYGEKSLSEIAYFLNYSSVAHLSAQFKKVTGTTPTVFKTNQRNSRKTLDEI